MSNYQIAPLSRPESPLSTQINFTVYNTEKDENGRRKGPWTPYNDFMDYVDVKDTTMTGYNNALKKFAAWLSDNGITQPTRDDLKDYRDALKASDLEATTQAQYLQAVKKFFKWTASEGIYPNVADNLKGPKIKHDVHHKDAFKPDEIREITDQIDTTTEKGKRLLAMFLLEVNCGLRCCEVSRANVCDLKQSGGFWYLWVQGKGHDAKDERVEVPRRTYTAIKDYLEARTAPQSPKSPLFTSTSNANKDGRIAPSTISSQIKQAMKAAGYDSDRLTAHSLRHTSVTIVCRKTHNTEYGREHARHANISTTQIYDHEEEREKRHSEQLVEDQIYGDGNDRDIKKEIFQAIDTASGDQLEEILDFVQGVTRNEAEAG